MQIFDRFQSNRGQEIIKAGLGDLVLLRPKI